MGYHDILCKKRHSQKGVAYWELLDTFLTNPAAPPQSYNHSAVGAQSITLPEFISDLSYSPLYTCIWAIRGVLREEGSNLQGFELSLNHVIYSFHKRGHVFPKNNVNFCPLFIETFCHTLRSMARICMVFFTFSCLVDVDLRLCANLSYMIMANYRKEWIK